MTAITRGQQLSPAFYQKAEVHEAESQRLELMAQTADEVSLARIDTFLTDEKSIDAVCIDIGAGDSTNLGKKILEHNPTATYLPIDIRESSVGKHAEAGFAARLGAATDLPFPDSTADVLHSRFTFGWLDEDGRKRSVEEMVRVGKAHSNLIIIDYDWSAAQGPESYNRLAGYVTGLMGAFGFDPYYGSKVTEDVSKHLASYGYTDEHVTMNTARTILSDSLDNALSTINATVLPVLEKLQQAGLQDEATTLATLLSEVQKDALEHPKEVVSFPDIVSVSVEVNEQKLHEAAIDQITMARAIGVETLRQEAMVGVGPRELNTYRLSNGMITQARKLHAAAYRHYNYVTEDGIKDGILIDAIDPQEIVDSSTYLGTPNDEGTLVGSIRLIHPENDDIDTLPTVVKIKEMLGEDNPLVQALPFVAQGARVFEASALGKSAQCQDKMILSKLLLSTMCEGMEAGYDYAVMSIVKSTARLLTAAYGTDAFRRIDGDTAVVRLSGEGIREEGVELVPFYVKLDSFIADCKAQFAKNPDSQFSQENTLLFDAAEEYIGKA